MSPTTGQMTIDYTDTLQKLGYNFRLNECTDNIEINGQILSDGLAATIRCQMRDKGYKGGEIITDVFQAEAYRNRYHPIKEYLGNLPGYDGEPHFQNLVSCFSNKDNLFSPWLWRWMIGTISKVFLGTQNKMLVLDGPQGIGKSKFAEWLCSGISEYFTVGGINTSDKDSYLRLTNMWIWEVSELGATTRKADIEALKDFISRGWVTARKSYARFETTKQVIANLIGTINNSSGILNDPTGSRRFLICHLENINWQEYIKLDVNLVWSQVYTAYLAGETGELTEDERKLSESNNQQYEVIDPVEEAIHSIYQIDPQNINWWLSSNDICTEIQDAGIKIGSTTALSMKISSICQKMNLQKKRKGGLWGYTGITKAFNPTSSAFNPTYSP